MKVGEKLLEKESLHGQRFNHFLRWEEDLQCINPSVSLKSLGKEKKHQPKKGFEHSAGRNQEHTLREAKISDSGNCKTTRTFLKTVV